MKILKLFFQSFIIGLAKITPGVSGSVLAISFDLYEQGIEAISLFFKYPRKYFPFLFITGSAIFLAMIVGSTILTFLFKHYYLPIMLLFLGTIIGGMEPIYSKVKEQLNFFNILIMLIIFILFFVIMTLPATKMTTLGVPSIFVYILIGFIDAATMVIPGISGTAILMILGLYPILLECLVSFTKLSLFFHNFGHLFYYLCGLAIGIYVVSRVMNYLIKKFPSRIYSMIFMLSFTSVLLLVKELLWAKILPHELILGTILFCLGLKISTFFETNA